MNEKFWLFSLSIGLGAIIAVHLAMNARVGELLGSPRTGNALFWMVGAVTGLLIWLTSNELAEVAKAPQVPAWLWLAGAMGAVLVLGISYAMPRLGVGPTTVGLLLGQLATGIFLSHAGWLSTEAIPVNLTKLVGMATMGLGVFLVIRG
jgi:bacterial/archaeal transporter family-2 protein